jgi:hypothetical protein
MAGTGFEATRCLHLVRSSPRLKLDLWCDCGAVEAAPSQD